MLHQRDALKANTKEFLDRKIYNKALQLIKTLPGRSVFCYESFKGEVATGKIISKLQDRKYQVSIPRIENHQKMVAVDFLNKNCDFSRSPLSKKKLVGDPEVKKIDIVLVPLIAFSRKNGMRIGYGGGFYDRWFKEYPDPIRVGLAYSFQQHDDIVPEDHDIALNFVVSELDSFDFDNHRLYATT